MKKIIFIFIVLLTFCIQYYNPDYVIENNIEVSLNGYKGTTIDELNTAIDNVKNKLSQFEPDKQLNLQQIFVHFKQGLGVCKEVNALCDELLAGYTDGCAVIVYYRDDPFLPLKSTAFAHEIAHVILLREKSIPTPLQDKFLSSIGL